MLHTRIDTLNRCDCEAFVLATQSRGVSSQHNKLTVTGCCFYRLVVRLVVRLVIRLVVWLMVRLVGRLVVGLVVRLVVRLVVS